MSGSSPTPYSAASARRSYSRRAHAPGGESELAADALAASVGRARSRAVRAARPGPSARRAGHEPQHGAPRPGRCDARRTGAAAGRDARHLARRGDQHPPGPPVLPRHVRKACRCRRPPPAPPPLRAVADGAGVRRQRIRRPAPIADRRDARDPRALPARTRAVRPPHGADRGRVRRRLAAAGLVRPGGADVRLRDAVRAPCGVHAAADDPPRAPGELGGVHPRHVGAAVVALLRPAADRGAAGHLRRRPDPAPARGRARQTAGARASPTPPRCWPCSSCCSCVFAARAVPIDRRERGRLAPSGTYDACRSTPSSPTWRGRCGATTPTRTTELLAAMWPLLLLLSLLLLGRGGSRQTADPRGRRGHSRSCCSSACAAYDRELFEVRYFIVVRAAAARSSSHGSSPAGCDRPGRSLGRGRRSSSRLLGRPGRPADESRQPAAVRLPRRDQADQARMRGRRASCSSSRPTCATCSTTTRPTCASASPRDSESRSAARGARCSCSPRSRTTRASSTGRTRWSASSTSSDSSCAASRQPQTLVWEFR